MALKVVTTNRTIAYQSYEQSPAPPCYPLQQNFSACTHQTIVARLEPEHRVKPVDLITSLTPRAKQYIQVGSPGFQEKHSRVKIWCGSTLQQYLMVGRMNRTHMAWPTGCPIVTLPPWQNDFRQHIADLRMNLAENLAEYRQTGSMFVDAARAADSAWADFRNRNWKRLAKRITPENVASIELVNRYGLKPLVSDLGEAIVRLNGALNRPIRRRLTSRSQDWKETVIKGAYEGSSRCRTERKARVQGYLQISPNLSEFHGGSPLEGFWATIPYSFVFDYFINVGGWLQQLDALRGVTILGITMVDEITNIGFDDRTMASGYVCTSPASYFRKSYERFVLDPMGIPMPVLRWKPSSTWSRVKAMTEIMISKGRKTAKRNLPWA